jgi:protein-disulfide isomerase
LQGATACTTKDVAQPLLCLVRMRVTIGSCLVFVLLGVGSLAAAEPVPSPATTGQTRPSLTAKQRKLVDQIVASYRPYECCPDTLAACLRQVPACPLAQRLEKAIVRLATAGRDQSQVEAALAQRRAAMTAAGKPAKIALDARFRAGAAKAPVTVVIYACPRNEACAKLVPDLHREVTTGRLANKVALFYRPFFPPGSEEALECGRGLYAAAYQGQFWPYLLHLCLERDHLQKATLRDWVGSHGLDRCIFDHTCEQPGTAAWLSAAHEEGTNNGVTSAPALFLDGKRIQGDLDLDTIVDLVEEAYERTTNVAADGARKAPAKTGLRDRR